ncbi:MAG: amidohydrolase family protein, partial [Gemmatimonadota bacterium]|nr:amidohydrolase family protein [Gemmatimonadota bacterium]
MKSRYLAIVLACFAAACKTVQTADTGIVSGAPYDLIIEHGKIVDGSGNAWFYGDVGIRGDRIARVAPAGMLARAAATKRIDATNLVVAPGFIDIQSHSREPFLTGDGRVVSKITQGITTEIMGEGWTNAPANALTQSADGSVDHSAHAPPEFSGEHGFAKWLDAMQRHGTSANFGSFIGATTVRMYAKGAAQGAATPAELDTMRAVVRNGMRDGAFGVASALIYPPGTFASTEELIEEAKAMSPYGGVYISHMRSEADDYLQAIDELLRIGKEGHVPVEIYHLKAAGVRNWTKAPQAIAKIDSARAAGQDVGADMYVWTAGGTGLSACLPPWASADGKLLSNLKDPATRAKIRGEVLTERTAWENLCQLATPQGVMIVGFQTPELKAFEGKRLTEVAQAQNKEWVDALIDLTLAEQGRLGAMYFLMSEENIELQMKQPWMKFGTDAGGMDPDSTKAMVHPRSYANYPRILGHYVRDRKVIPLEDAVRKMSAAVAERLSIADRGLLREGMFADVVVFDPATVADRSTYQQPHQLSAGVR